MSGIKKMKLSELINLILEKTGLTQGELAQLLSMTQANFSRIKNGKQIARFDTVHRIVKLAREYKIKVNMDNLVIL